MGELIIRWNFVVQIGLGSVQERIQDFKKGGG